MLKQVTGNVRILVVNPKDEEDKRAAAPATPAAAAGDKSKLATPAGAEGQPKAADAASPAKTPAAAPAASPAKAAATPAKSPGKSPAKKDENTIELTKDAKGLGISIVGGSDTPLV